LGSMFAIIVALHVIGWGTLILVVEPAHLSVGDKAFGIGIGLTAYTLGLRHAFDADHIAAIDNTTRKLMNDGQRPLSVGFFFSLGHSSVVFGLSLLIAVGLKAIIGPVEQDSSALHHYTSLIGTSVSGVFLYLIAIINVVILVGILRVFAGMRRGHFDEDELEAQLNNRGLLNRVLGRFTRSVTASWHMYPIGVLFGLGFDTATEVALLVLAGTSAAGRPAVVRHLVPSGAVHRGHVPAGHHRRLVHEFRLRLGVFQPCSQGLLQHHHHRTFGGRRAAHRQRRVARAARRTVRLDRRILELAGRLSTSTRLVLSSSACSSSRGPAPC